MASRKRRSTDDEPVTLTDPRAIRALAHPARLAVLDGLSEDRTLTATEAAQLAGLTPSAMSYHLRALAKWGIIREADSTGDARERRWRAAGRGLRIETERPGAETATAMVAARYLDETREKALRYLERATSDTPAWQHIAAISHIETWMTEEQARELSEVFERTMERFRTADRPENVRPENVRRVRLTFVLVPIDEPAPAS